MSARIHLKCYRKKKERVEYMNNSTLSSCNYWSEVMCTTQLIIRYSPLSYGFENFSKRA